jgi:hypothetical protein
LPGQLASSGLSDWTVKTREKPGKSRQFDHESIRPRVFAFSTFFRRWNRTANAVTSKAGRGANLAEKLQNVMAVTEAPSEFWQERQINRGARS